MKSYTSIIPPFFARPEGHPGVPLRSALACSLILLVISAGTALGAVTGKIAGTVSDPSGARIPMASITITNTAQGLQTKVTADEHGDFILPSVPVGTYDILFEAKGFRSEKRTSLVVDTNAVIEQNMTLQLAQQTQELTVTGTADNVEVHVETASTQMGDVVAAKTMTDVALNGRSFTDLLALQPGIVPMSTQTGDSVIMAGASVQIAPSGGLNAGNQSISGQREDANGYLVNGGDVKELMNGGTTIIPNLDSIAEFRVLTNNFDAEFGNYSGGIVNVITKSGANQIHGSAFEFLRNTDLDARNFFSPDRSFYRQNQFGGTLGGPIRKNKIFYFGDYQGTRGNQGIDTGLISVPSLSERTGNLSGIADQLTGSVSGPYIANILQQKLGYGVTAGEPYYTQNCTSNTQCVFPNAVIPTSAWSAPAQHLLQYIPQPNVGSNTFSTGSVGETTRDDKGSFRFDANTDHYGTFSAYYFFDDFTVNNPYPSGQGGATVPGFNALNLGRAQLVNFTHTKTFGGTTVNEFHVSFMRDANNVGQPSGGVGPSLASQGFVTGAHSTGIFPLDPSIEGIETVGFNSFTMGLPTTNLKQWNNTYGLNNNFSRVMGDHSIKAGFEATYEQVNVTPNPIFNGSFQFQGQETGSDFADFLIGTPFFYNQQDSQSYYIRHRYQGAYLQDSWRVKSNLTFNYGVRYDHMEFWSEKYNQIPTYILGEQSVIYPNAPTSLVYPGDPGVPNTLVPSKNRFSPRIGLAWSPNSAPGFLNKIVGGPGKTSIRAGYGIFESVIEGNVMAIDEPQPPYGLSYTSPAPPLFAQPFVAAGTGTFLGNPYPFAFPPLNATASHPNTTQQFGAFLPQNGMTTPIPSNTYPYNENYFFSIERQVTENTLFSISYVGSQAHHLLLVYSANPGNPALCLKLSVPYGQPGSILAQGTQPCGPGLENNTYLLANGQTLDGTRGPLGPNYGNDDYDATVGNSNYNALQVVLRHAGRGYNFSLNYTWSKSIDQASSISDTGNPFNLASTRALSAFDLAHNFVASYTVNLPFDRLSTHWRPVTRGWQLSGITRISSGFPVTLHEDGDNSLQGSSPNGVNNHYLDTPDYNGTPLDINSNPRNGKPYFNIAAFTQNALGEPGTASRRSFFGPGMFNSDLAVLRNFHIWERGMMQFRFEAFNAFNHAQFFGPASVQGEILDPNFGYVVKAQPPRLVQIALKLTF
jgi:Carboxypeptidase regulatory-like domain/TonB dependent receptor